MWPWILIFSHQSEALHLAAIKYESRILIYPEPHSIQRDLQAAFLLGVFKAVKMGARIRGHHLLQGSPHKNTVSYNLVPTSHNSTQVISWWLSVWYSMAAFSNLPAVTNFTPLLVQMTFLRALPSYPPNALWSEHLPCKILTNMVPPFSSWRAMCATLNKSTSLLN